MDKFDKFEMARRKFNKVARKHLNRLKKNFEKETGVVLTGISIDFMPHYTSVKGRKSIDKSILNSVDVTISEEVAPYTKAYQEALAEAACAGDMKEFRRLRNLGDKQYN